MSDDSDQGIIVERTADGTVSARDPITGELFHNNYGAYVEALENYAVPSRWYLLLKEKPERNFRLLDACFGLGYNTFVFWDQIVGNEASVKQVDVLAVEKDRNVLKVLPDVLAQDCFEFLSKNRVTNVDGKTLFETFEELGRSNFAGDSLKLEFMVDDFTELNLNLIFDDLRLGVRSLVPEYAGTVDFIFHDPFSPNKLPQLWTADLFKFYHQLMEPRRGRLLTYSAATAVRGGLEECGFTVYRTRALGAKTGGTLALANPNGFYPDYDDLADGAILPLLPEERERMLTASGVPYRDPELNSDRREVLKRRDRELKEWKSAKSKAEWLAQQGRDGIG